MIDIMASYLLDVHLSKAKLSLFHGGNCILIASMVAVYSHRQMLLRVVANSRTSVLGNAVSDYRSSRFDIAFQRIRAETNPNMC